MIKLILFFMINIFAASAHAAISSPSTLNVTTQADTLLVIGTLPFIPAALLLMTGFTRILIVLSLLRHALGLQTTPPNQVIIGLSLILTFCVMQPALDTINKEALTPWRSGEITIFEAAERTTAPLRSFMEHQVRAESIDVFYPQEKKPEIKDIPLMKLTGAFALSELKTGFEIGVLVFVPFLVIDIIISSILMSLGMMMLSPSLISLPLKVLIFVLIDGWNLIAGGLLGSFAS